MFPIHTDKMKPILPKHVNPAEYVFLPKYNLYVSMNKHYHNNRWGHCHSLLHEDGAVMLTAPQLFSLKSHLESGNAENGLGKKISGEQADAILGEMFGKRKPCRGEWLDLYVKDNGCYPYLLIEYNHRTPAQNKGVLVAQNREILGKDCLMTCAEFHIDISSINSQGFPTRKGTDILYYSPDPGQDSVASLLAGENGAILDYDGDIEGCSFEIGVRKVFSADQ
jgi:hypothetical protein